MNSRCPESAEDAGSRNQSQTRHLRAKAGPELAAGGRTRPGLSAERGGGGCEARPLETPGNRPPAAGAPAPAGRSAARCCQVAAFSGSHRSTLRPPGIQAGLASRVPEPARAPPPRTPGSFSARARGPFPSCGGQGADSGGAETEGLAAAGTTEARDSGPAVAGTCARSCSLFDSCRTMFPLLVLLSQLPAVTFAFPHCTRSPEESRHAREEVFTSKEEANLFIHRHLLYNRFDLELFTPGDLERECTEELCNYEEAREIFVDEDKTKKFWQEYSIRGPTTKSDANREKIDAMGLLTGLIAAGVFLVILGLVGYYLCITKCHRQQYPGSSDTYVRRGRHTPSIIFRRPEEAVLSPSPPSLEDTGLPSYEQAVALTRKQSVSPPPPYPGPANDFRVFKKSMSLPSH